MKKYSYIIVFIITALAFSSFTFTNTNSNTNSITKQDTLKKVKVAALENDSLQVYKGKFKPYKIKAHASYYAVRFHGKRTASGKIYDMNKFSAAHKKLPFGTKVKVTNEKNGKSVVVEITDRGPFVKGREIDLSRKAFTTICGSTAGGSAIVTLEVLQN